jgi:glutathione peroxidase
MKAVIFVLLTLLVAPGASLYDLKMNSIDGKLVDMSQYKGKTLLIVNVASKCGYTPQYTDLEKLHETYGSKVTILAFPANNFKGQEPGTNAEIADFCSKTYGVKFSLFEKISVIGDDQHPLYAWLKEKTGQEPTWNFCKYIIKPDGTVKFFNQKVNPMGKEILDEL